MNNNDEYNRNLLREYYRGNKKYLGYIIEYNSPLIFPLMKKFQIEFNLSNEYIYKCIVEEFINAVNEYDLEKSSPFEVYIKRYIETKLEEKFRTTGYQYKKN